MAIHGVCDAPKGFVEWAIKTKGSVSICIYGNSIKEMLGLHQATGSYG